MKSRRFYFVLGVLSLKEGTFHELEKYYSERLSRTYKIGVTFLGFCWEILMWQCERSGATTKSRKLRRSPKEVIFFETEKCRIEGFSEFIEIVFIFWRGCWRDLIRIKWGCNKKKKFSNEMEKCRFGEALENPLVLLTIEDHVEIA